jgi:uncharacterized protein YjaZ
MRVPVGIPILCCLLALAGPATARGQQHVLDQDDVVLVDSIGTNGIFFHTNTTAVESLRPLIIGKIKIAVESIGRLVEVENVEFRILVFPEKTIPRLGMSGAAPNGEHLYILLDPAHPRLETSLVEGLVPTIAHEFHHTLRHRTVGYGTNLFEALVSEGLADHFSIEVTGIDPPPWFTTFTDDEIRKWRKKAETVWFDQPYDHLAWFIGLNSDIPRGTGYAIGFQIVGEYLQAHPGESAATLYDEPADSFLGKARPDPARP